MPDNRLNPIIIKSELESLIKNVQPVEPDLANRLKQIKRSIKKFAPAEIMSRKILADFLSEVFEDSKLYLTLSICTVEEKQEIFENLTCSEKYWYEVVFPNWFSKHDPNFSTWIGKMKSRQIGQNDKALIDVLSNEIENKGGDCFWGFILDLSMATDLVVSASLNMPLCVQLTTVSKKLSVAKKDSWEAVLCYWGLKRGLFVSFSPKGHYGNMANLADFLLQKGDDLPSHCYDHCYV